LGLLADETDNGEFAIEDMTEQRNLLLKSFVGSQKLALSYCHNNYERAKYKAFSKMIGHTYNDN